MKIEEVVYYCLDAIKALSDDSYVNEDHILFLLGKYRGALLQQYHNIKKAIPESNYQTICISLLPTEKLLCRQSIVLRSDKEIPSLMTIGQTSILLNNGMESENIVFTNYSRLKNTGYNKWKTNFIYAAIGPDKHLYLTSANPQFQYLSSIKMQGIFEDYEKASELSCNNDSDECIDIMKQDFPLEVSLVPDLIARVVRDILGVAWRPKDTTNNAADDLADISTFIRRNMKTQYQKELEGDSE